MKNDQQNAVGIAQQIETLCLGNPICAVLTPFQLEKLCRLFALDPSELKANFDGWCKHVLMSKDLVFLFPRHPGFVGDIKRELMFYEQFTGLDSTALPRLIRRVKDRDISYYEFGAITRLRGVPFNTLWAGISFGQMEKVLVNLAEVIAVWHSIAQDQLPKFLFAPARPESKRITIGNWHKKVLYPTSTEEAVDFIYHFVSRMSTGNPLPGTIAEEAKTKAKWTRIMTELAELNSVLVHGDIHECHVFVEHPDLEITGVIDWQTARIDNPVWDFNFGEWGMEICRWWNHLPALRRQMWSRYLEVRRIRLATLDGLNLFYCLWDMIWLLYKRRNSRFPLPTNVSYEKSVQIYLQRLDDITTALEK